MKRVTLYWCDGEYMKASKVRRLKKNEGFNFERAFKKTMTVETFGEKAGRITRAVLYWIVVLTLAFSVFYLATHM